MQATDLCFSSIADAADKVRTRELSPVELVDAHLGRIEQTDGRLNSFITLLADDAKAAALRAEQEVRDGGYRGALHGIPIGLKDLYYTKGIRTTVGTKILRDFVPDYDAAVTERFQSAGAILMGKLQMHEFALGATSENPHDGPAHNPWNVDCVTGGSSGGSGAAVAAGQVMGALGSDTGGSVRIPAGLCGIVGLKPTFGRISRHGVYPLSWSLDTVGPMTRTVRDAALMLNAIAGHDPRDPSSADRPVEDFAKCIDLGVKGLRVGVPKEFFYDVIAADVRAAVDAAAKALEDLGASVEETSIPVLEHSLTISGAILITEAAEVHLDHLRTRPDDIGEDVRSRLEAGVLTPATDYIKAQRARTVFNSQIARAFETFDILLAPCAPIGAPRIGQESVDIDGRPEPALALLSRLTRPFNICGVPTVSLPCGFTSEGMPIGLQMAGKPFAESTVLRVAHAYEQATDWHTRRPPI